MNALLESGNLFIINLNVTNEPGCRQAALEAIDKFGKIDVLVNNAGFGLLSAVEEASASEVKANYEAKSARV